MKKYTYRSPEEDGYRQVQIPKHLHNSLFPRQKTRWCHRYEYYLLDDGERRDFRLDRFTGNLGIVALILVYPFNILLSGLGNFKQMNKEYMDLFRQKAAGSFYSVNSGQKELIDIIKNFIEQSNERD